MHCTAGSIRSYNTSHRSAVSALCDAVHSWQVQKSGLKARTTVQVISKLLSRPALRTIQVQGALQRWQPPGVHLCLQFLAAWPQFLWLVLRTAYSCETVHVMYHSQAWASLSCLQRDRHRLHNSRVLNLVTLYCSSREYMHACFDCKEDENLSIQECQPLFDRS